MKKALILVLALALLVVATSAFATVANTKHNLSASGAFTHTTNAGATVCGFCHIPHGGSIGVSGAPLWARNFPVGPYQLYGGGATLQGTTINTPGKSDRSHVVL